MPSRIIIFDDNNNIRDSITMLLNTVPGFVVAGSFSNGMNCIAEIKATKPDIVLMDIAMPGMSGIEAVKLIKKEFPNILVLMQTVFEDDERVFDSICAGASGYILKSYLNTHLITSIQELQYGGAPMSPSIARKVLTKLQSGGQNTNEELNESYHLTNREKEILACLVDGLSYKMIAAKLFISYETVRSHVKNIYEKLHVASLTEVVAKAIKQRIVR